MSQIAINSIVSAMESWKHARKTNPPCPIHTQMALAHYQDAHFQIGQRIKHMEETLEKEK